MSTTTSTYNHILASVQHADPITAIDINVNAGLLLSGSATGQVTIWDISNKIVLNNNTNNTDCNDNNVKHQLFKQQNNNNNTCYCHVLCPTAEEGIQRVYFGEHSCIFALVGDSHIRYWDSISSTQYKVIRIERYHNYNTCINTRILHYNNTIVLISPGLSDGLYIDLSTGQQLRYTYNVPINSEPIQYNGQYITYLDTLNNGKKYINIRSLINNNVLYELTFEREHKYYSAFQTNDKYLLHVCCSNKLKLWNLNDLKHNDNDSVNDNNTQQHNNNNTLQPQAKCKMTNHKANIITAVLMSDSNVASLSLDNKLYVWSNGKRIKKYKNLKGQFYYGYPYLMIHVNQQYVIYTADDGVYAVDIR